MPAAIRLPSAASPFTSSRRGSGSPLVGDTAMALHSRRASRRRVDFDTAIEGTAASGSFRDKRVIESRRDAPMLQVEGFRHFREGRCSRLPRERGDARG